MGYVFYSAGSFSADLSGWDVSSVTSMSSHVFRIRDVGAKLNNRRGLH
eukprot:COSAG05_NODE_7552_length_797_cov_54.220982_1_plen_48_part_00